MGEILRATEIASLLHRRFCPPAWSFLEQVRNGTGWGRKTTRTADAIAMSLWPSRGLELHGFEIKCNRNDWKRELDNPEKAEDIQRYCNRWWIVVSMKDIVKAGELPPTWGLMACDGGELAVVVEATALPSPLPIDRLLLASILRNVQTAYKDHVHGSLVEDRVDKKVKNELEDHHRMMSKKIEELQGAIVAFEQASGVRISTYDAGRIGEAVKAVLFRNGNELMQLKHVGEQARRIADQIDEQLTAIAAASIT